MFISLHYLERLARPINIQILKPKETGYQLSITKITPPKCSPSILQYRMLTNATPTAHPSYNADFCMQKENAHRPSHHMLRYAMTER